jgi:ribosomal protein S18 acetylase RimI-like enzyme
MAGIAFRTATESDLPAIVALLADDVLGAGREQPENPLPQGYRDGFAAMSRQADNEFMLAVDGDGAILGCLQLTLIAGLSRVGLKRAQIECVRVAAAARGRGVGAAMMREAIARARTAGCRIVQLASDASRADAHRFYERLGFVASHVGMKLGLDESLTAAD